MSLKKSTIRIGIFSSFFFVLMGIFATMMVNVYAGPGAKANSHAVDSTHHADPAAIPSEPQALNPDAQAVDTAAEMGGGTRPMPTGEESLDSAEDMELEE